MKSFRTESKMKKSNGQKCFKSDEKHKPTSPRSPTNPKHIKHEKKTTPSHIIIKVFQAPEKESLKQSEENERRPTQRNKNKDDSRFLPRNN